MKKAYNLKIENTSLILENLNDINERFCISINKLQFDAKAFYDTIFSDVNKHIEIAIEKDKSLEQIKDPKIQKIAYHVYDTIISITDQVCSKLNEECFKK